ncbi:MAG: voltage-gated chloride channel family protein [Planctomycetaceae bacterium]
MRSLRYLLKWILLASILGMLTGSSCALFLWLLDHCSTLQAENSWLLWLLPVAGVLIGLVYSTIGKSTELGNNLILNEIHEPRDGVPVRMAPLVLLSTLVTHLFGGSAGREGTAVQMGGSLASGLSRIIPRLSGEDKKILLTAGIASGFAGVFGTPVAGMVFAMEVLTVGRLYSSSILPCLIAAIVGDQVCLAWGIGHTRYSIASLLPLGSASHIAPVEGRLFLCTVVGGVAFGLASLMFSEGSHALSRQFKRFIPNPLLRPLVGGVLVIVLFFIAGTDDYLGLGVNAADDQSVTIVKAFYPEGAKTWSWLWKLVFTVVTLSSGFKGGEVTPLFFIGATLGNTLSLLLGVPPDLFAGLGFVAVFAAATNCPLASTVMAVELFGGEYLLYFAVACLVACFVSGRSSIYSAQRHGDL